jgi:hypothetical protein
MALNQLKYIYLRSVIGSVISVISCIISVISLE